MNINLQGGHINRTQVYVPQLPPFETIRNTIIEANKDIYDDTTDSFYMKPKLNIKMKLQIFTIMNTEQETLKTEKCKQLTELKANVITEDETKYIKANEMYTVEISILKRKDKGVDLDREKLLKYKSETPEWEKFFNIIKSNGLFDAENNYTFFTSIKSSMEFITILKHYMANKGKLDDWDRYIKLYKNIHQGNTENIDEYIKDYEKIKKKKLAMNADEDIIAEIVKNEEKLRLKFTSLELEYKLDNWREIYESNKVLIEIVKNRKKNNSNIVSIEKEVREIDNIIIKIKNYIKHTELFNSKIITEYIDSITLPIDINDIIVLQKIKDNIVKKDNDTNSIKCIENLITLDSINADNIHQDIKGYYNTISETLIDSDIISRYKKVISNIVPFIINKDKFFSFLAGTDNRKYTICKKIGINFYEIYKSFDGIVREDEYDTYILNNNYTFTITNINLTSIIKKNIACKYPNFSSNIKNIENFIESQVLMSNTTTLNRIIIFYNKFIGENFIRWNNTFCVIDPLDKVVVYKNKVNTMKVCILASKINYYFDMYDIIDKINEDIDEENKLTTRTKIVQTKNIWDKIVTPETADNIRKIQEEINKEKRLNRDNDIGILKLIIIITKYIKDNRSHNLLILNELTGYENKDIIISIIKCIINNKLPDNEIDELGYSYNFYSINSIYDEIEGNINSESTLASIRQLNSIIKCDIEQLKSLFILNFIKELYYYYLSNQDNLIKNTKFNFYKTFIRYIFFRDLKDDLLLSKITNTFDQYNLEDISKQPSPVALSNKNFETVPGWQPFNIKFFYNNLFSGNGITDNFISINYIKKNSMFKDPRNELKANKNIKSDAGRPFCGEICLLNFINLLLYNVNTQSLDSEYFPDSVNPKLKLFFHENKKINNFNNDQVYTKFYTFLKNIPFELKQGTEINTEIYPSSFFDRDYGDWDTNTIYRYFTTTPEQTFSAHYKTNLSTDGQFINDRKELPSYTMETTYKINKGNELRLSYFNLCRVLAYLLNLDGVLHLDHIQNNLTKNTLKDIINKFKNPNINKYVASYEYKGNNIYNLDSKNINILDYSFSLAGHSDVEKISGGKNIEIYKMIEKAEFYDYTIWGHYLLLKKKSLGISTLTLPVGPLKSKLRKITNLELKQLQNLPSENIYDISFAFYAATIKNNNIFSEINFGLMNDDDIIKFYKVIQENEIFSFTYNKKIILELIETKKDKSLNFIFLSNNFVNDDLWSEFIKYRINNVDHNRIFHYINNFYIVNNKKKKINKDITRCILYGMNHINLEQYKLLESKIVLNYIELIQLYDKNREVYNYLCEGKKLEPYIKTNINFFKGYFHILLDDSNKDVNNDSIIEYFNNLRSPNSIGGYDFHNRYKITIDSYLEIYTNNIKFSNSLLKVLQKINIIMPFYGLSTIEIFNEKIFLNYDLTNYKEFKENKELFKTYGILLNKSLVLDSNRYVKSFDKEKMIYKNINRINLRELKYFNGDIVNNIIESNLKIINIILLALEKHKQHKHIVELINIFKDQIVLVILSSLIPYHVLYFYFNNRNRENDQFRTLIKQLNDPEIKREIQKIITKSYKPKPIVIQLEDEIDNKYKKYKNKYLAIKKTMGL
jgi:hypothetical protein